jgi:multidrug transporter EmrE-like cation transporter
VYAVFQAIRNKVLPNWRSVVGGIVLGVPNYLSMHFMMKALSKSGYDSSIIFPLANIGVVVSSAFIGILFFKEKQSKINLSGLGLAILAIALIIFSKAF